MRLSSERPRTIYRVLTMFCILFCPQSEPSSRDARRVPQIPFRFGRVDYQDGARCPENGRLPDASKGADHLRQARARARARARPPARRH